MYAMCKRKIIIENDRTKSHGSVEIRCVREDFVWIFRSLKWHGELMFDRLLNTGVVNALHVLQSVTEKNASCNVPKTIGRREESVPRAVALGSR